jgi:hypothetical protein
MCQSSDRYSVKSPSGKRTVVVSVRNCGATTGLTTVVSEERGWFRRRVDLLTIDGEALGEKRLRIGWFDDNEIVVGVDSALVVHPATPWPSDLSVGYEPGTRLGS